MSNGVNESEEAGAADEVSTAGGGALLDVLHEVYSSLSSSTPASGEENKSKISSSSPPPSPSAAAAAQLLVRASKRSVSDSPLMDNSLTFYLPEDEQEGDGRMSMLQHSRTKSGNETEGGNAAIDDYSHVTFPTELDFAFASAVFETGLRQSSPKIIMGLMNPDPSSNLTTEHIKSHLQKFRQHYNKSNDEFVEYYTVHLKRPFAAFLQDGTYAKLVADQIGGAMSLSGEDGGGGGEGDGGQSFPSATSNPLGGAELVSSSLPIEAAPLSPPSSGEGAVDAASAQAAAAAEVEKATAEVELYRSAVMSILDDEREMASLQRLQTDLMTQHLETQTKLHRFLHFQAMLHAELQENATQDFPKSITSAATVTNTTAPSGGCGGGCSDGCGAMGSAGMGHPQQPWAGLVPDGRSEPYTSKYWQQQPPTQQQRPQYDMVLPPPGKKAKLTELVSAPPPTPVFQHPQFLQEANNGNSGAGIDMPLTQGHLPPGMAGHQHQDFRAQQANEYLPAPYGGGGNAVTSAAEAQAAAAMVEAANTPKQQQHYV